VLLLAVLLDLVTRELPSRFHPTVWIGKTVAWVERVAPRSKAGGLPVGVLMALLIPAFWAAAAWFAARGLQELHPLAYLAVGAILLKPTFALRMLHRVAADTRSLLPGGDSASDNRDPDNRDPDNLVALRENMRSLVSRDVSALTAGQAIAATVESVSENTTDSFIGPWLAFALFGLPGAFAYRAINTLDSMIGYHGEYEYLGKAAARLDDLVNLIPARLTALLLALGSIVLPGQRAGRAWRIMWRDHARTASPNAGWTMSGMAGALGVELEKEGHYRLGDPTRTLEPQDISRAIQTMYLVAVLGAIIALGVVILRYGIF
jgi:adenosylcobinamide-phosphate synthase